jgi:hypothetical protein
MRRTFAYAAIGVGAVFAVGALLAPAWFDLSSRAASFSERPVALQSVNRAGTGDRLQRAVTIVEKTRQAPAMVRQNPPAPVKILKDCEPAFSPLSVSARANIAGRCSV